MSSSAHNKRTITTRKSCSRMLCDDLKNNRRKPLASSVPQDRTHTCTSFANRSESFGMKTSQLRQLARSLLEYSTLNGASITFAIVSGNYPLLNHF
eukprot:1825719-Pyramimonas_sp.AAC.2